MCEVTTPPTLAHRLNDGDIDFLRAHGIFCMWTIIRTFCGCFPWRWLSLFNCWFYLRTLHVHVVVVFANNLVCHYYLVLYVCVYDIRAGFSWWGAWGPAIGVGDGGGMGVALPHYTPPPSKKRKIFFSGKHKVKFGHFPDKCRVKFGHFVNFLYIISGKNVLPLAKFDWAPTIPPWARHTWVTRYETVNVLGLRI